MTGPGLVTLPIVAQSAGWLPTVLGFLVIGLLSTLSSLFICEAMTEVPGNEYFQSNVEFSNLVLCFFGRRSHLLVQIICFLAMQTTNIASIAVSVQLFDNLLIKIFNKTCGIQVYPNPAFICVTEQLAAASPFTGVMIMTTGVLLSLCMIVPLGLLKLSENIWLQLASFVLILLIMLEWIVTFCLEGLDTSLVPAVGSDISQTFGTILFNYAFITTVPSWANAKQPNVSIHKTVGWGVGITTTIYVAIAILGGMAFQIPSNSSLIQAITSSPDVSVLSQITGYTFPIAALITSIPINIIVIRYNLIQSGACNMLWANIFSGLLPWLVAIPCMTGSGLTAVINWSSLILVSAANFIIPFILYIYSKRHRERLNKLPIIEMEQQARLSRELSRSSSSGHSRRNTIASISGSIRRRLTGSNTHLRSPSHSDLTIGPQTGIAAASVIPITLGIGSGSLVYHSSEESLAGEASKGTNRRYHPHSPSDAGEHVSGPYFSFSRDGEPLEREPRTLNSTDQLGSRIQSSPHRQSGVATVILHDPGTETSQRKSALSQRISHKDKFLSLISDKHKRAMEQQAKRQQEEQSEKPVPPMILLSQSAAPELEDNPNSPLDIEIYAHQNDSYGSETCSEKGDMSQTKEIAETNDNLSTDIKNMNRKSSAIPSHSPKLSLSPSSPPTGFRGIGDSSSPRGDKADNTLELPSSFSPPRSPRSPRSPVSPKKPNIRWPPASPPGRGSPRADPVASRTATSPNLQLPPTTRVLHSAANIPSLDRRVSFSDEQPQLTPVSDLEHTPTFSSESKRVFKAAVASLAGGSPIHDTGDELSSPQEYKATLLEDHLEADKGGKGSNGKSRDEKEGRRGELGIDKKPSSLPNSLLRPDDIRRDSLGRMAAAFVSQPGSFSIKTTTLSLPSSSRSSSNKLSDLGSRQELNQRNREEPPHSSVSLEPSAPPTIQVDQNSGSRNRTVSASALQDGRDSAKEHNPRSPSAQSLRENVQRNQLAVPGSANSTNTHLTPHSPQRTTSPFLAVAENRDSSRSPTSSVPPSPLRLSRKNRSSDGGHGIRLSGNGKTLAAPFQSGNNYSIPGFGSSHSPSSPSHPLPSPVYPGYPGYPGQDQPMSAQGFGPSWINRRSHTRDPSRSSCVKSQWNGSIPPSPHPSLSDAMGVETPNGQSRQEFPMTPHSEVTNYSDPGKRLSLYALENGIAFDPMWSLRAIPTWIPVSSLKIAWGSLGILASIISATIVYDFVQLALGNDVVDG
ncbi:hypothetical protein BGZ80_009500 [Entomortierella chlamydospora]|uniref:Amino acid transporter transmembrane domain-containing protein n=1 Tax=Entomortierella chlamydospora TaxID=101097 RepID=A0A9P6MX34_9FUNG|nr:hypothetical protein BGZ80_009500 [Entomortierella chlamydospora]